MREFVAVDAAAPGEAPDDRASAHLTLRFLGEVPSERNASLVALLAPVARATAPFRLRLEGLGAFPSARSPRVVWLGVTLGRDELATLAERVRAALAPAFGADREGFVPHLTLWRVRSAADREAARELLDGRRPPPAPREVEVAAFCLKESVLAPGGARHRTIARFPLTALPPPGGEPPAALARPPTDGGGADRPGPRGATARNPPAARAPAGGRRAGAGALSFGSGPPRPCR